MVHILIDTNDEHDNEDELGTNKDEISTIISRRKGGVRQMAYGSMGKKYAKKNDPDYKSKMKAIKKRMKTSHSDENDQTKKNKSVGY